MRLSCFNKAAPLMADEWTEAHVRLNGQKFSYARRPFMRLPNPTTAPTVPAMVETILKMLFMVRFPSQFHRHHCLLNCVCTVPHQRNSYSNPLRNSCRCHSDLCICSDR